ncbi:hypothetical protein [uncultured Roseobacter sp.]|uniref:hypothetical protein n=1 Tax=uncultured Roseobacter sp. TaxID=114847 RepID=UPI00262616FA|nr:hypothetical protein [uncultured Roseobacter sp.]
MRRTVSALLVATTVISACSSVRDSRVNPFNWFGRSEPAPVPVTTVEQTNPLIPARTGIFSARRTVDTYTGSPVGSISNLVIDRVPGGAIIRATGIADRQGVYDVRLTPVNDDETAVDGVLSYRLEARRSQTRTQGPEPTRQVVVARKVTDQTLAGARTIRVEAERNALQARR